MDLGDGSACDLSLEPFRDQSAVHIRGKIRSGEVAELAEFAKQEMEPPAIHAAQEPLLLAFRRAAGKNVDDIDRETAVFGIIEL